MTNKYFKKLNDFLFSSLQNNEIVKTGMWGENSQFIRLNNSKIRQTGLVNDLSYSIALIHNKRQASCSFTLNGNFEYDKNLFRYILGTLREDLKNIPVDPFIVYPSSTESSEQKNKGVLPNADDAADLMDKLDYMTQMHLIILLFNLLRP